MDARDLSVEGNELPEHLLVPRFEQVKHSNMSVLEMLHLPLSMSSSPRSIIVFIYLSYCFEDIFCLLNLIDSITNNSFEATFTNLSFVMRFGS